MIGEAFFTVCLTANIGYFTNFIAIKMLFRPYDKSALGRQGLIPRNQKKLAASLSATLSDHFLASEHWEEYLHKANLLPQLIDSTDSFIKKWLAVQSNRLLLLEMMTEALRQNRDSVARFINRLQSNFVQQALEEFDPESFLEQGFEWIEQQFETQPEKMTFVIEPVINTIAGNVPLIASRLVNAIDQHIEKQDTLRRSVAKAARWSANFSEEDIKNYLFRLIASTEFRHTLFEGLESLVKEYKRRGLVNSEKTGIDRNTDTAESPLDVKQLFGDLIKGKLKKLVTPELLISYLQKDDNKVLLADAVDRVINQLLPVIKSKASSPEFAASLYRKLSAIIEDIDLKEVIEEKASGFSPAKMESIFHNMIADQLVFIELLGAFLGALSGLALIDLRWFAALASGFSGFYLLDLWLTSRNNNPFKQIQDSNLK